MRLVISDDQKSWYSVGKEVRVDYRTTSSRSRAMHPTFLGSGHQKHLSQKNLTNRTTTTEVGQLKDAPSLVLPVPCVLHKGLMLHSV
jgi:hypothetical protein